MIKKKKKSGFDSRENLLSVSFTVRNSLTVHMLQRSQYFALFALYIKCVRSTVSLI